MINKQKHTYILQVKIRPYNFLHCIMWGFFSGLENTFYFGFSPLLYFIEDVSDKVKYASEASNACYLHIFHTSLLGRKMLLRKQQEVKCQMQLKDTQSEGFCVGWIMNVEHELWIKSFLHLMMTIFLWSKFSHCPIEEV